MEVWRLTKRVLQPITTKGGVNTQDKRIELITGGIVEFWSLDSDPEACRGRDYDRIIVNEAAKCRSLKIAWELAIRPTLMDREGDAYFTSTPRGRDYYYKLYQKGVVGTLEYQEEMKQFAEIGVTDPQWYSCTMSTYTNPHIKRVEIDAFAASMPSDVKLQEIDAVFLDIAGTFFDEWEPTRKLTILTDYGEYREVEEDWHVVDPFPIPAHWHVWAAGDPGTSKNSKTHANLLMASDEEGGIVVFDEIYESGLQSKGQALALLKKLEVYNRANPVDPEHRDDCLWKVNIESSPFDYANFYPPVKDSGKAPSPEMRGKWPVEYYLERGLPIVKAVKDRVAGWREVKQVLHDVITIKDDVGDEDIRPKIRVFRGRCSNLVRTIPLMIRDERNPEDIEEDKLGNADNEGHLEQHLCDALRYGLMTRPKASPKQPGPPKEPPRDGADAHLRVLDAERLAGKRSAWTA